MHIHERASLCTLRSYLSRPSLPLPTAALSRSFGTHAQCRHILDDAPTVRGRGVVVILSQTRDRRSETDARVDGWGRGRGSAPCRRSCKDRMLLRRRCKSSPRHISSVPSRGSVLTSASCWAGVFFPDPFSWETGGTADGGAFPVEQPSKGAANLSTKCTIRGWNTSGASVTNGSATSSNKNFRIVSRAAVSAI